MTNHQDKELSGDLYLRHASVIGAMTLGQASEEDVREIAAYLSENFAASPQLPVAEQPAGQAVSDAPIRSAICSAITSFGHEMSASKIVLHRDNVAGGNLLTQIVDRVVSALAAAPHSPVAQMSGGAREAFDKWFNPNDNLTFWDCWQAAIASHPSNAATQDAPTLRKNDIRWDLFPAWLIEHCEGETVTEEGLQRALGTMIKSHGTVDVADYHAEDVMLLQSEIYRLESELKMAKAATVPQVVQATYGWVAEQPDGHKTFFDHEPAKSLSDLWKVHAVCLVTPQPVAASPSIVPTYEQLRELVLEAMDIQYDNYGNGVRTHLAFIEWAKKACSLLTTSNAGEAKQGDKS